MWCVSLPLAGTASGVVETKVKWDRRGERVGWMRGGADLVSWLLKPDQSSGVNRPSKEK